MTEQHDLPPRSFFNADDLSLLIMAHPDAPQFLAVKIADEHDAAMAKSRSRIEALERDNARMREALEQIEAACPFTPPHPAESEYDFGYQYFNTADDYALHRANRDASSVGDIARRALARATRM